MKIADLTGAVFENCRFECPASGPVAARLVMGESEICRVGRIGVAGFSGTLALPEKLRRHSTHDGLCVEFDSSSVIPFGCEYQVRRHWTLFNNIAMLTCDIAADNGGVIRDLELEPLEIALKAEKIEYMVFGDEKFRTAELSGGCIYCGTEPVLMLRVSDKAGCKVEYVCGDDIWRHRAGSRHEGFSAEYRINADADVVTLCRKVLITPEEAVVEKRPWKFKSILSWYDPSVKADKTDAVTEKSAVLTVDGCFDAPEARRKIRKAVRHLECGRQLTVQGEFPVICFDPAHLERSGHAALEHSDLGAAAADFLWANRELAKRGGALVMQSSSNLYGESVVLYNLGSNGMPLTVFDGE